MTDKKNTAGATFSYPEAHKKLTLLLCHKGMATFQSIGLVLFEDKTDIL